MLKLNDAWIIKFNSDIVIGIKQLISGSKMYHEVRCDYDFCYEIDLITKTIPKYELTVSFRLRDEDVFWTMGRNVLPRIETGSITPQQWSQVWAEISHIVGTVETYLSQYAGTQKALLEKSLSRQREESNSTKQIASEVLNGKSVTVDQAKILVNWVSSYKERGQKHFKVEGRKVLNINSLVKSKHIVKNSDGTFTFASDIWSRIDDKLQADSGLPS